MKFARWTAAQFPAPTCVQWAGEAIKRLSSKDSKNGISALQSMSHQQKKSA
jgi:hypothetical protein